MIFFCVYRYYSLLVTHIVSALDHIMREVSPDVTFRLAYSSSLWTAFIFLFLVKHHLYLEGQIKWYN